MSKQVAFLWMIVLLLCAVFMAFAGGEIEAQTRVKAFPDDPLSTEADRKFIRRTYEIARKAAANGYRPYAALLVHEGRILAEHENTVNQSGNITKHAEVNLLGMATEKFPQDILSKSTLYTSGEPCLMCCGLIDRTSISRIVFGASGSQTRKMYGREYRGIPSKELFQRIKPGLMVVGPVFEEEGLKIHADSMRETKR